MNLFTVRDFVRYTITQLEQNEAFYGHGCDNAWDEALFLVFGHLKLPQQQAQWLLDAKLLDDERHQLAELIKRRCEDKVPTAYLVGKTFFAGYEFLIDESVIIPRSPIARLIEAHFAPWKEEGSIHRVMDLCCGSGCIGIATALELPDASVDMVDISAPALKLARANVTRFGLDERVQVIASDLMACCEQPCEGGSHADRQYDLILANPPYVDASDLAAMPAEYHHEPHMALDGGNDGLDIVHRILPQARRYLHPQGLLVLEVGNSWQALEASYPELPFTWLEFEDGSGGVCVLTADELKAGLENV